MKRSTQPSRRRFLALTLATAANMAAVPALARPHAAERAIAFHNIHTGESLNALFWADGRFVAEGLSEIDRIMRDYRTDEIQQIDRNLIALLHRLQSLVGTNRPFHIISGYRSPKTNAMLRKNGRGVAVTSLHMQAKAADVRLPGVALAELHRAALSMQKGGVGYYPKSDFIHVDTGRTRKW